MIEASATYVLPSATEFWGVSWYPEFMINTLHVGSVPPLQGGQQSSDSVPQR